MNLLTIDQLDTMFSKAMVKMKLFNKSNDQVNFWRYYAISSRILSCKIQRYL